MLHQFTGSQPAPGSADIDANQDSQNVFGDDIDSEQVEKCDDPDCSPRPTLDATPTNSGEALNGDDAKDESEQSNDEGEGSEESDNPDN